MERVDLNALGNVALKPAHWVNALHLDSIVGRIALGQQQRPPATPAMGIDGPAKPADGLAMAYGFFATPFTSGRYSQQSPTAGGDPRPEVDRAVPCAMD